MACVHVFLTSANEKAPKGSQEAEESVTGDVAPERLVTMSSTKQRGF